MIKKIRRWLGLPVPYPAEKDLKREIARLQRVIAENIKEIDMLRNQVDSAANTVSKVYAAMAMHYSEQGKDGLYILKLPKGFFSAPDGCAVGVMAEDDHIVVKVAPPEQGK